MTQETDPEAPAGAAPPPPARTVRRRTPRPDPLLVDAVAAARTAVAEIAEADRIGAGHRVLVEEDRLVTHLFECTLPGYRGWNWFASLARAPRSRTVTVCEVGLLPGEDALLAPEWVPWSERVSAEERAEAESAERDDAEDAVEDPAEDAAVEDGVRDGVAAPPQDGDPGRDGEGS